MSKRIAKKSDDEYKARKLRGQQEQARRTPYNFKMRNGGAKYEKTSKAGCYSRGRVVR